MSRYKSIYSDDMDSNSLFSPQSLANRLADTITDARVEGDKVILPNSGAAVHLEYGNRENVSTLYVSIDHPSWDRTVYEQAGGRGVTADKAVDEAMLNLYLNLIHLLDHHGCEAPDDHFSTMWAGHKHNWSVWFGNVYTLRQDDQTQTPSGYWQLFRELLTSRVGNQKVTYVKVTSGLVNGEITAEVRINNLISAELTTTLYDHIKTTWQPDKWAFQKQFFWIIQDDATYQSYPHRAPDIRNSVVAAGRILESLLKQTGSAPAEEYESRLTTVTQDPLLSRELNCLLPEIIAHYWREDVPFSDWLWIESESGKEAITYHQIASYAYLCEAVGSAWGEELTEDIMTMFILNSDLYPLIKQADDNKVPITSPVALLYDFGDGYHLR